MFVAKKYMQLQCIDKTVDSFGESVVALKNLGLPADSWEFVLFHSRLQNLHSQTVKKVWTSGKFERTTLLCSFQNIYFETVYRPWKDLHSHINKRISSVTHLKASPLTKTAMVYNYCTASHSTYRCPSLLVKSSRERYQIYLNRGFPSLWPSHKRIATPFHHVMFVKKNITLFFTAKGTLLLVQIVIPVPLLLQDKPSVSFQEGAVALPTQSLTSQYSLKRMILHSTVEVWIKDALSNFQVVGFLN